MAKTQSEPILEGEDWRCTLSEFLEANEDGLDETEIADLRALKVGDEMPFGGGAAALSIVRRVA